METIRLRTGMDALDISMRRSSSAIPVVATSLSASMPITRTASWAWCSSDHREACTADDLPILWGDHDDLLPRDDQETLARLIPSSLLITYQGTGHLVLWEQPDRVAADLIGFVRSISQGGP